jgi:hypothetical protein
MQYMQNIFKTNSFKHHFIFILKLNPPPLLLDSIIRNSVCTPAKLPCRRVVEG